MANAVWSCDTCGTVYEKREEAEKCEEAHRPVEDFTLLGCVYADTKGMFGSQREYKRTVPDVIRVKFSDKHGDFASYKISHYGFVGL